MKRELKIKNEEIFLSLPRYSVGAYISVELY